MTYQFNFNAAQVQLIVEALRTKSNEFQLFSDAMLDSAQKQLAIANAAVETVDATEEVKEEVIEDQIEAEKE